MNTMIKNSNLELAGEILDDDKGFGVGNWSFDLSDEVQSNWVSKGCTLHIGEDEYLLKVRCHEENLKYKIHSVEWLKIVQPDDNFKRIYGLEEI